jgi:hypothetical protein
MESIIHADIFFFVATIGFGIVAIVLCVAAVCVIRILREVECIVRRVREGVDHVSEEAGRIVHNVAEDGVFTTLSRMWHHTKKKKQRTPVKNN